MSGCRQGREERGRERRVERALISRVGTLPLKSLCYLVVNPTLCFLPARIALLSCVSVNGSRGGILPCAEIRGKKKKKSVRYQICQIEIERCVFALICKSHLGDKMRIKGGYVRNNK